ncbi:hypothetical protein ACK8P5_10700 [Paenibacillus sp. EC2-1]|uniref:hypothetical protein n=1 Tax=Paenibacillus sp. EC2-1 TaxID=3388665 RepID=UPI003BEF41A6
MKNNKKVFMWIFFIFVLCALPFLYYSEEYHIENNEKSIQTNLTKWLNRGSGGEMSPHVKEIVRLGASDTYITLFQLEDHRIGYAQMIMGWNGKLKIGQSGYGTNEVSYRNIDTNQGMYGIVIGYNIDFKIDHLFVELQHEEFSFSTDISQDELFIKFEKLPKDLKETYPARITCYDQYNNVI